MRRNFITVDADVRRVTESLKSTNLSLKNIRKKTLQIVSKKVVKAIKQGIKNASPPLKRRSGELIKSYVYKVSKNTQVSKIFPKAITTDKIFPKVMALSYGTDKRPNRHLTPRGFVQKGKTEATNGNFDNELQKMIDKEISKYWG